MAAPSFQTIEPQPLDLSSYPHFLSLNRNSTGSLGNIFRTWPLFSTFTAPTLVWAAIISHPNHMIVWWVPYFYWVFTLQSVLNRQPERSLQNACSHLRACDLVPSAGNAFPWEISRYLLGERPHFLSVFAQAKPLMSPATLLNTTTFLSSSLSYPGITFLPVIPGKEHFCLFFPDSSTHTLHIPFAPSGRIYCLHSCCLFSFPLTKPKRAF